MRCSRSSRAFTYASSLQDEPHHWQSDFIVVGCDLITDFPISRLVQRSRMSDAAAISLLATPLAMNFMQQVKESTEPKHRLSEGTFCHSVPAAELAGLEERIVVGLDAEGKRLLSWIPRESIEEGNLKVPMALLTRYPHLRLLTDLHDMHCYVLRRTLLDREEVLRKSSFSIREEIVPDLVRRQFGTEDNYTCEAIIADTGHCVRANSLSSLAECGKQLVRMTGAAGGRLISQAAEVGAKTQIGNDSMIGDHSKIGEKSSVKRSVVGKHCQIGNNVKVSNSVIMDYAVVEDGCRVEGSTIGLKVVVREKSYLKDCDVGPDHVVEAESRNCALQLVYF